MHRGSKLAFVRPIGLVLLWASAAVAQDMVRVPAGPFTMGSDDGPADERPAHIVSVPEFEIDRLPVSNAQFALFLQQVGAAGAASQHYFDSDDADARVHRRDGSWRADAGYDDHPVVEASWAGANAYCRFLGKRLPTEAEWEKAARGVDGRRYPWGDAAPSSTHARFGSGYNQTAPAGTHPAGASPYGALDMAGNVWQWVSSAYRPYPYREDDGREDPASDTVRGTRGGGHDSTRSELRTTERGRKLSRAPAAGHHNIGFRCARSRP
jgi:formylglycine-generating enzyme required for sulfatase activity